MKKIALLAALSLLSATTMNAFAAEGKKKTAEEKCKAQAAKQKIGMDKMDEFVKACVEKHSKKMGK